MALELAGGAVVGAVAGELLKAVLDAKDKVSNFRNILARIEDTLKAIIPRLDQICGLNHKLDLQQKEMQELISLIESGKALILKCSKISTFNLVKKLEYSKELLHLDNTLLRYFMTILPLDQFRDNKEILVMVRELHMKLAGDKDEAIINNQSESGNPRKDSGSGSHEALMLHQDSKKVEAVKLHNDCKMELHVEVVGNKDEEISNRSESVHKPKENPGSGVKEGRKLYQGSETGKAWKLYTYQNSIKEQAPELYQDSKNGEPFKLYQDSIKEEYLKLYQDFIKEESAELYLDSEKEEALNLYQDSKKEEASDWYHNFFEVGEVESSSHKYIEIKHSGMNYKKEAGKLFLLEDRSYDLDEEDLSSFLVKEDLMSKHEVLCDGTYGTSYRYSKMKYIPLVIKRLKEVKVGEKEFKQQIEFLRKIGQHPNIKFPMGYYFSAKEKLLLYDLRVSDSLFQLLHAHVSFFEKIPFGWKIKPSTVNGCERYPLSWENRVKIALGTARGISYLHSVKFIYGNIESSNVLVTWEYDGIISDYGLDPIMNLSATTSENSGYCAPEFIKTGVATQKSDVYSFGIMLLELILQQSRPDEHDLRGLTYRYIMDGRKCDIFDWELGGSYDEELEEMLDIAVLCVEEDPDNRPNMDDVVRMVEKVQTMSPEPEYYSDFCDYLRDFIRRKRDNKEIFAMVKEKHITHAGDKDEAIGNNQSELGKPRKDSGSGSHEAWKLHLDSKMGEAVKFYSDSKNEDPFKLYQDSINEEYRKLYQDFIKEKPVELYQDSDKEEAVNLCQKDATEWYYNFEVGEAETSLPNYVEIKYSGKNFKKESGYSFLLEDLSYDMDDEKETGKLFLLEDRPYDLDVEDLSSFLVNEDLMAEHEVICNGTYGTGYRYNKMKYIPLLIKRLKEVKVGEREFKQQIKILTKIGRHPNIKFPMGYYFSAGEKLLLYDLRVSDNLFQCLHGHVSFFEKKPFGWKIKSSAVNSCERYPLSWKARVKIALGTARGISHLHSVKFIYGNIESSNVLITWEYDGIISDYGLNPIMNLSATTYEKSGYCAPELIKTGVATQKSDVYSFGIMLLELILQQSRPDEHDLRGLTYKYITDGRNCDIFDWELGGSYDEELEEMLDIAVLCVEEESNKRPNMDDVVRMIENIQTMSPEPEYYSDFCDYLLGFIRKKKQKRNAS